MHIPIKKDLEEAYKHEFFKGFTLRETMYLAFAIFLAAGVTVLVWRLSGLAPDVCVYVGVPCAAPVLLIGFYKVQGLTIGAYLKEVFFAKRTRLLLYDADELPLQTQVFTLERKRPSKSKRKDGRGRTWNGKRTGH